jgi:type IV pilus assembly protein PilW
VIGVTYTPGNPATFVPTNNFPATPPPCVQATQDSRIFNFTRDFVTVTYFLQLDTDPNDATRVISSLYRGVNTGVPGSPAPQQIVQGVERLNFLYNVQDSNGLDHLYTAAQVTTNPDGLTCPPPPTGYTVVAENGCLWRAVRSVEVFMLLNTIDNMAANAADMSFRYSFNAAGVYVGLNAGNQPAPPPAVLVSGVNSDYMMRREFRSLVSLHNYVP